MTTNKWRTAYASAIGTSHEKTGAPCQDSGSCCTVVGKDGSEILIAIVCDGAGSSCKSEIGSALTVDSFLKEFCILAAEIDDIVLIDKSLILDWLVRAQAEIKCRADSEGLEPKDFACTVIGAIIGAKSALFFQIGDGSIVISEKDSEEFSPVFWPQHGEFANQTNFIIQDNIAEVLEFAVIPQEFDKVALFSDGLERLILDFSSRTVHSPSLQPIFSWLRTIEPSAIRAPSEAFMAYLTSDLINKRTDDDKTLIMATRRLHEDCHEAAETV